VKTVEDRISCLGWKTVWPWKG